MTPDEASLRPPNRGLRMVRALGKGFLGLAALISAAVVVIGAGLYVHDRYRENHRWREVEYSKLRSVHAGYTLARFEAVLGAPIFFRIDARSNLREASFRRRGYWVQAVSRGDGTVLLYSVTACTRNFHPEFAVVGFKGASVTLGKTTFDKVMRRPDDQYVVVNYFRGVTANTTYVDEVYGGNPSNYKTYAWGVNDACPGGIKAMEQIYKRTGYPKLPHVPYRARVTDVNKSIGRFRHRATVNTYAETAPSTSFRRVNRAFQTGVDRLLTRTAD